MLRRRVKSGKALIGGGRVDRDSVSVAGGQWGLSTGKRSDRPALSPHPSTIESLALSVCFTDSSRSHARVMSASSM